MSQLDEQRIREALEELSRRLAAKSIQAEVCLFGGAAMILAFQARQTTKDIDAIFAPAAAVRELAKAIGEEKGYDS
jgi:chorismate mutase